MTGANSYGYSEKRIYASTPMIYDIEAAQYLYAEEQTSGQARDGNNAYAYDDKAMVIQTIVDSGGTDTIDASRVTRNSVIDLTPGSFSSIGIYSRTDQLADIEAQAGATVKANVSTFMSTLDGNAATGEAIYTGEDNVAISTKTYIENATGGSGDDTITGNFLNNTITGGDGDDTIDGGDGGGDGGGGDGGDGGGGDGGGDGGGGDGGGLGGAPLVSSAQHLTALRSLCSLHANSATLPPFAAT